MSGQEETDGLVVPRRQRSLSHSDNEETEGPSPIIAPRTLQDFGDPFSLAPPPPSFHHHYHSAVDDYHHSPPLHLTVEHAQASSNSTDSALPYHYQSNSNSHDHDHGHASYHRGGASFLSPSRTPSPVNPPHSSDEGEDEERMVLDEEELAGRRCRLCFIDYHGWRFSLVLLACLQAVVASGIFYGWASLYTLFLETGVYSYMCKDEPSQFHSLSSSPAAAAVDLQGHHLKHAASLPLSSQHFFYSLINTDHGISSSNFFDSTTSMPPSMGNNGYTICDRQKAALQFIYTVSSSVNLVSQLPWGFLLDQLGPRICSCLSTLLVILGFTSLSLADKSNGGYDLYLPAMVLLAGAGPGVQISLFHLSELFPSQKSTVLSIITGAFQLSFTVFLGFKWIHSEYHLSLGQLSIYYCLLLATLLVFGLFIWPDRPLTSLEDKDPLTFTSKLPPPPPVIIIQTHVVHRHQVSTALPGHMVDEKGNHHRRHSSISLTPDHFAHPRHIIPTESTPLRSSIITNPSSRPPSIGQATRRLIQSSVRTHNADGTTTVTEVEPPTLALGSGSTAKSPRFGPQQGTVMVTETRYYTRTYTRESFEEAKTLLSINANTAWSPEISNLHAPQTDSLQTSPSSQGGSNNINLRGLTAEKSFLGQLSSPSFLAILVWMCFCLFWANFYIGTVVEQLYYKSSYQRESTRYYTDGFNLLLPVGVIGIPLFGIITDRLGFTFSILATCILGATYSLINLSNILSIQILAFIAYSFFRTFLFSLMFAYLAHEFGYKHFGLLSGIVLGVSGALGFLQYPLQLYVQRSSHQINNVNNPSSPPAITSPSANNIVENPDAYFLTNVAQFLTMCLSMIFAVFTYYKQRSRSRRLDVAYTTHEEVTRALLAGAAQNTHTNQNQSATPSQSSQKSDTVIHKPLPIKSLNQI